MENEKKRTNSLMYLNDEMLFLKMSGKNLTP